MIAVSIAHKATVITSQSKDLSPDANRATISMLSFDVTEATAVRVQVPVRRKALGNHPVEVLSVHHRDLSPSPERNSEARPSIVIDERRWASPQTAHGLSSPSLWRRSGRIG